jgi:hypothetical protein
MDYRRSEKLVYKNMGEVMVPSMESNSKRGEERPRFKTAGD